MPTFQGSPEEYARMIYEALGRDGFKAFYTTENHNWGPFPMPNNAINLIRCSDGVYRPERKPSPMSGLWSFGAIRRDGGGIFNTTGS